MSIEAVADAAGVGKPTIYRRYATKADLATAAIASGIEAAVPLPDELDVETALTRALNNLARRLRDRNSMALVGTLLVEEERTPDLIAKFRERVWSLRARHLREILERARDQNEVRASVDIDAVINMLIGSLYAAHIGDSRISRDWPARVVRTVLDGLR